MIVPKGELQISVIPERESFSRRAEESAGAGFGRDKRSEHGPPRNAPAAQCEILKVVFLPAHPQADEDNDDEVEEENADVDGEAAVHAKLGDRIFRRRKVDRALRRAMLGRRGFATAVANIERRSARSTMKIRRARFRSRENAQLWTGISLGEVGRGLCRGDRRQGRVMWSRAATLCISPAWARRRSRTIFHSTIPWPISAVRFQTTRR